MAITAPSSATTSSRSRTRRSTASSPAPSPSCRSSPSCRLAGVGGALGWSDLIVFAICTSRPGSDDGRLPPPLHASRVQDRQGRARRPRRARLGRDRGPGDLVGRRPPQAPRLLRPGGRPAQPARRPRRTAAGRAARPLPRARRLAVHPHAPRQQEALRARPDQGPGDPLGRPHVLAVGRGRAARAVRARLADRRHAASGAHRHAVGRRRAHARRCTT